MCQRNVKFQVKETKDKGNPNTFSIGIGKSLRGICNSWKQGLTLSGVLGWASTSLSTGD